MGAFAFPADILLWVCRTKKDPCRLTVIVSVFLLVLDIVIEPIATAGSGAKRGSMVAFQGLGGPVGWSRRM